MAEIETAQTPMPMDFDRIDSQRRSLMLNIALVVGILASACFGIFDTVGRRIPSALASLSTVIALSLTLFLNIRFRRFRAIINAGVAVLVGIVFLVLLATQFPHPTVSLWCLLFPFLALFLLDRMPGLVAVVIFNAGVICIFFLHHQLQTCRYSHDYVIRYCGVLFAISVVSYCYEASSARSLARIKALNQSLEQRVEERTQALEKNQARLRQAEKLESIGLLAGGIAHDLNNQLTGITAFADLIRIAAKDDPDVRESAEGILAGTRRSADLANNLLAFARKGSFLSEPVDIHHTIADVMPLLEQTIDKRITIRQQLDADPSTVLGDPTQLHNALLNLALNARDAMPAGGELTFTTSIVDLDDAFCRTLHREIKPGAYLHLCMTDTGCGMDDRVLQRIFEPFFTTKEQGRGTGMGLPAVYGTVRSHKGAITVHSEPGQGSSFDLYLPLPGTASQVSSQAIDTVPLKKGCGHVLLVDDEPAVSQSTARLLQVLGYTATLFSNGKEALDYYVNSRRLVDLVILDMVMPVMGGKDTFIAMKKINPDIVALLLSGYGAGGEAQSVLDMGARGFISKPFTLSELRRSISALSVDRA